MNTPREPKPHHRRQLPKTTTFASPASQSFAERKAAVNGTPRSTPVSQLVDGDNLMRGVGRPPPGDVSRPRKLSSRAELRKQRSAYFEDAFAAKEADPVRERIRCESIVMAEVRTNVIISDEFTFITELSYHLSSRFQRPVSSIVVNLQHGVCMFFGGTFEPAYVMSIFALSSQLQPTTNKRNSALISKHMEESLGVAPPRGLLRFVPLQEENVAYNGKTVAWEIEDMEKASSGPLEETNGTVPPKRTRSKNRLSMRSFASLKATPIPELTPPASAESNNPGPGLSAISTSPTEDKASSIKTSRRKYGFVTSLLGRGLSRKENMSPVSKTRDV